MCFERGDANEGEQKRSHKEGGKEQTFGSLAAGLTADISSGSICCLCRYSETEMNLNLNINQFLRYRI